MTQKIYNWIIGITLFIVIIICAAEYQTEYRDGVVLSNSDGIITVQTDDGNIWDAKNYSYAAGTPVRVKFFNAETLYTPYDDVITGMKPIQGAN